MMGGSGLSGGGAASSRVTPQQANMMGRAALLKSGIAMSQVVIQNQALALGQTQMINLLRVGITTGVMIDFVCSLDISGTMTASPAGPWPLINSIIYTDFSGINRVNTNAMSLYLLSTFKHNKLFHNAMPGVIGSIGNIDTDILTFPTAEGETEIIYFSIYVPMAYEPSSDLRGAIPSMVNVGQHYLQITPTGALVNTTDCLLSPYTAGTATINDNGFYCNVTQFYIQPQSLAAPMLPGIDLTTIYELNGNNVTTSGFLTGSTNMINFPNDRSVMSAIMVFENGGTLTLNGADLTMIGLLVNSNTQFRQWLPRTLRGFQRELAYGDAPSGVYYFPSRRQPILTNLYATVQAQFFLGTINSGVTKIVSQFESFYPSGQPLSGITPNAG